MKLLLILAAVIILAIAQSPCRKSLNPASLHSNTINLSTRVPSPLAGQSDRGNAGRTLERSRLLSILRA